MKGIRHYFLVEMASVLGVISPFQTYPPFINLSVSAV